MQNLIKLASCQLTFFGLEKTSDRCGRGALRDLTVLNIIGDFVATGYQLTDEPLQLDNSLENPSLAQSVEPKSP